MQDVSPPMESGGKQRSVSNLTTTEQKMEVIA